jgi:hypothetical protein
MDEIETESINKKETIEIANSIIDDNNKSIQSIFEASEVNYYDSGMNPTSKYILTTMHSLFSDRMTQNENNVVTVYNVVSNPYKSSTTMDTLIDTGVNADVLYSFECLLLARLLLSFQLHLSKNIYKIDTIKTEMESMFGEIYKKYESREDKSKMISYCYRHLMDNGVPQSIIEELAKAYGIHKKNESAKAHISNNSIPEIQLNRHLDKYTELEDPISEIKLNQHLGKYIGEPLENENNQHMTNEQFEQFYKKLQHDTKTSSKFTGTKKGKNTLHKHPMLSRMTGKKNNGLKSVPRKSMWYRITGRGGSKHKTRKGKNRR